MRQKSTKHSKAENFGRLIEHDWDQNEESENGAQISEGTLVCKSLMMVATRSKMLG